MSGGGHGSVGDLVAAGLVAADDAPAIERVAARFAVKITPTIAAAIDGSDPADPIARQFVPDATELEIATDETADPIGDDPHTVVAGLIHRYPDRVLLKPTHLCRVHCRFCFRREVVGEGSLSDAEIDRAIDEIAGNPAIFEVILTGGDPLVLSDRRIDRILTRLEAVSHVAVVRFHSRVPVVDPERISEATARMFRRRFATWVVIHVDHPRELGEAAAAAIGRIVDAGVPVLSQTTLLAGVNAEAEVLEALFRRLVALRVKPYYLHHLDRAEGTARFRTPIDEGRALMRALRGRLTGIAQPTYVLDIPGGAGKVPIGPDPLERREPAADGRCRWTVEDPYGERHAYDE